MNEQLMALNGRYAQMYLTQTGARFEVRME